MNDQERRLTNYFEQADRFLWGFPLGKGQRETYKWLADKGFTDKSKNGRPYRGPYKETEASMVLYQGIRRVIDEIVIPQVKANFDSKSLEYLSKRWHENEIPKFEELENVKFRIDEYGGCSFLETSIIGGKPHVDRWSNFAKMYFIELEDLKWESDQSNILDVKTPPPPVSPEDILKVTQKLYGVLEKLPYGVQNDKNKQMIEKVLVLVSLSTLPETKPIYDQLSRIIDFGQMMILMQ
jgi:hypothetical protein